jgi:SAM-dependent methyltransferase
MKAKNVSWALYLRNGLGRRISQLGERLGIQSLIYNPMVMRQFHDGAIANAPLVISPVLEAFPSCHWILDVGSGSGAFSAELQRRGKSVIALERSDHGRRLAAQQGVDCRTFDLLANPPASVDGPFDLVLCFEVAEHMPPDLGDRLVQFIAGFKAPVLFSAAHPGQGGTGHINEQPYTYWVERFEKLGFRLEPELTERLRKEFSARSASSWFCENPFVVIPSR